MRAPSPAFVLGFGIGTLIRPVLAVGTWLLWQHDARRTR